MLVNRQVLADPAALGPEVKVWARLKDGTPLVTAAKRGDGQLIFFHVTANSDWSNLPLSGLFVEMLRRIASLGGIGRRREQPGRRRQGRHIDAPAAAEVLAPLQVLDGFGLLKNPPPTTQAIAAAKIVDAKPSAENPPGYYGPAGAPRALNLMTPKSLLKPLPAMPMGVERRVYEGDTAQPLKPQLLSDRAGSAVRRHRRGAAAAGGRRWWSAHRAARASSRLAVLALWPLPPAAQCARPSRRPGQRAGHGVANARRGRAHHPGHRQGHVRLRALWRRVPPTRRAGRA